VQIRVRYFAAARDLAGRDDEALDVARGPLSIPDFFETLGVHHPRLAAYLPRMRLAINGEFAAADATISDGDEVVLLPPVAGGSGGALVDVRDEPLSVDECMKAVSHAGAGGICVFTGIVRDQADGKPVARLDYEAYTDLAIREMRRILSSICEEIPGVRLSAVHRVGELAVGDLAIVIAASAPHRQEAFEACRLAIDRIKETVPVWKKEWAPDGSANWVNLEG